MLQFRNKGSTCRVLKVGPTLPPRVPFQEGVRVRGGGCRTPPARGGVTRTCPKEISKLFFQHFASKIMGISSNFFLPKRPQNETFGQFAGQLYFEFGLFSLGAPKLTSINPNIDPQMWVLHTLGGVGVSPADPLPHVSKLII